MRLQDQNHSHVFKSCHAATTYSRFQCFHLPSHTIPLGLTELNFSNWPSNLSNRGCGPPCRIARPPAVCDGCCTASTRTSKDDHSSSPSRSCLPDFGSNNLQWKFDGFHTSIHDAPTTLGTSGNTNHEAPKQFKGCKKENTRRVL